MIRLSAQGEQTAVSELQLLMRCTGRLNFLVAKQTAGVVAPSCCDVDGTKSLSLLAEQSAAAAALECHDQGSTGT